MLYSWLSQVCIISVILTFSDAALSQVHDEQKVIHESDVKAPTTKLQAKGKKNIVFILSDDQDSVLDSVSYMPRLQKHIIEKGKSFVNHFTTTAICCPSRVSLWTGKQPHNTNVTDVNPPYGKILQTRQANLVIQN